jgi:hypothetical protein
MRARSAAVIVFATMSTALPPSTLAVRRGGTWRVWWDARTAPVRWQPGDTARLGPIAWRRSERGIESSEVVLAGSGEAWRTRVVVARIDSRRIALRLDTAFTDEHAPAWTVDRARDAAIAVNAGQFLHSMPWGRVVFEGSPWLDAGIGPLSSTVIVDSSGSVRIAHGAATASGARFAFQSYPTLLRGGEVPIELQSPTGGVDLAHRDARAAIGVTPDGRILVALTRFDALGTTLGFIPFGLTTPEMAAVMGALGARDAVMLDGGISGQLTIRDASGVVHAWRGSRAVPLALVGRVR